MPRKKKDDQKSDAPPIELPKMKERPQLVKGMKDILPSDQPYWEHIRDTARNLGALYSFERIDTPVVEDLSLFTHGIGKQTDIVEKEMYAFDDQGGAHLALRPEFTAGIARAYLEHGMGVWPQPVKLYAMGPVFRHDKPQEGRYRQHNQFSCEIIGEGKPAADAQLMFLGYKFLRTLGLTPQLHVNSIGCLVCRAAFKEALIEYYRSKRSVLCEDCKRRLTKNPLRVLDCKVEACQELKGKAPHIVDSLCEACQAHFMSVVDFLDELDIPYQHNPHLVRGIDYYTRTVFEFYAIREELPDQEEEEKRTAPIALGGGGRYDNLIEMFGGQSTPAAGFGIGLERVVLALKAVEAATQTRLIPPKKPVDIFVAQLGEQAKRKAMVLFEDLIAEGFSVAESFTKDSLKAQLELANKMDVKLSLILGQQELIDGTIIIRNMEGGEQEVVDRKKLIKILHKKLTVENGDATQIT
ncbi:MAG: histidine--tRNA ligase [Candidatus Uhrbacteria bacterium]|nr:histidine--tRNA ligase [Candidatus Uhrbacteria bacterium]